MNQVEKFYELIKKEIGVNLATSVNGNVSMRVISPVYFKGDILIFTAPTSRKYAQMKENPYCCIAAGGFFAEASVKFMGPTMLDENEELRAVYCEKMPGAFDVGTFQGGRESEFILIHPTKLSGWAFASEQPAENEIPSIPFEIALD